MVHDVQMPVSCNTKLCHQANIYQCSEEMQCPLVHEDEGNAILKTISNYLPVGTV
jgi:hypothetical protein